MSMEIQMLLLRDYAAGIVARWREYLVVELRTFLGAHRLRSPSSPATVISLTLCLKKTTILIFSGYAFEQVTGRPICIVKSTNGCNPEEVSHLLCL